MMGLTAKQRKHLKALAHSLDPVVRIGQKGISAELLKETERSLEAHELIKVRVDHDSSDARKELASSLASEAGAEVVNTIGKIAILYRARAENPSIKLP